MIERGFMGRSCPKLSPNAKKGGCDVFCATASFEANGVAVCPPVVEYSREFQARATEELASLLHIHFVTPNADRTTRGVGPMHLEHVLRLVEPDRDNLQHNRLPLWIIVDPHSAH
ncbi:hypothetical protein [Marivita sp.]|uniref:hypothetical protein n=1 Tax=Marivita sp. TaxID=2003365 RepID=UPI0026080D9A|nr:hypothetical protein [Marivita sp.]